MGELLVSFFSGRQIEESKRERERKNKQKWSEIGNVGRERERETVNRGNVFFLFVLFSNFSSKRHILPPMAYTY